MQINNTNTTQNFNEINKDISQDQNVESTQGEPKAKVNNIANEEINDPLPLYSRELAQRVSTDESESEDYGYSEEVVKAIKLMALKTIDLHIKFIHEFIDSEFSIEYNETNSTEELAYKMGRILAQITPEYIEKSKKYVDEVVTPQMMDVLNPKLKTNEIGFDAAHNGNICWNMLELIFKKHTEYSNDRNILHKFNFIQNSTDILVENIDSFIGTAILKLENIKEEKYFSIFRTLIDTNQALEEKYLKVQKYFGLFPINEDTTTVELAREFYDIVIENIQNMASYVTYLQILIDGLTVLKKAPKTIENTKLLLQIFTNCFNCYEEEKAIFITIKKNQIAGGNEVLPLVKDYFHIKSWLTGLQQQLSKLIDKATPIKSNNDDWSTSSTRAFFKNQSKQKQAEKKSKKQKTQKKLGTGNNQAITSKTIEVKKEGIKNEVIFNKQEDADTQPKVLSHTLEEKEAIINAILSDINLENESFEDIERETNAFMEIFRQVLEKDRSRKLQLKEERQKQSSSVQNPIIINNIITPKPEIIKLGTKHQETLNELFKEKPGHLVLLGADIESLIKILQGSIEGCGNGSKFKIFWGDSNKQAGAYEVTHGSDLKGYLTSKYASRVAEAIKQGIDRGYIARETIENINLVVQ